MKNYYYIGINEFTTMNFCQTFIDNKYDKERLFEVGETIICKDNDASTSIIFKGEIYWLRTNVILQDENMNVLCYYKDY